MQSNKGRFKCPNEAQAVWNCALVFHKFVGVIDLEQDWLCENEMAGIINDVAEVIHKSRLIHGTIYDEDGRIENKDVAHLVFLSYERFGFGMKESDFYEFVNRMTKNGEIRGTIFY